MVFDQATKDRISAAVHAAVMKISGLDRPGICTQYAIAGCGLLNYLDPTPDKMPNYLPQAGSLWIYPDPTDPTYCFGMLADNDGYLRGEVHAWIAVRHTKELIDFSARHYAESCTGEWTINIESTAGAKVLWNRPQIEYTWCHRQPEFAKMRSDPKATQWLADRWLYEELSMSLMKMAIKCYGTRTTI